MAIKKTVNKYYRLSLLHTFRGTNNAFVFWGMDCSGYQQDLSRCGLYDDKEDRSWVTVHKDIVDGMAKETYTPTGEMRQYVPNIGDNRKIVGITELDLNQLDMGSNTHNRDYFTLSHANDLETVTETYKTVKNKNEYRVYANESVDEYWYIDYTIEAPTRNKALSKAFTDMCLEYDSFIEFKKDMRCKQTETTIFNEWRKA